MTKNCQITHAITKDSYPTMPHLETPFKVGDILNIHKSYFRNGEHWLTGTVNGVLVDVPDMWTNHGEKIDKILSK